MTRQLEAERELERLATIDSLTGLPNRRQLDLHLNKAMARSARTASPVAVLFIDLDGFKAVNDTFGHDTGDELLVAAAARVTTVLREGDVLARLGGDEFVIIAEGAAADHAAGIAQRTTAELERPFDLDRGTVRIGGSVGWVIADTGATASEVMIAADAAMYEQKRSRKAANRS